MKRFSFIAAVLLCFVTAATAAIRPAQPGIGGGGGAISGSITGAYSFSGGFTTANATNVSMLPAISNLALNLAITNKFNAWELWTDPVVTNRYHAENRALGITTNSVDFSALLQSLANRGVEGFSYRVKPNPYYTNAYVFSNAVTFTNWGTVYGESAGNPTVVFRAAPSFSGSLIKLGTPTMRLGGISRWTGLRFEMDQGATNATGIEIVNVVEPVLRDNEFTGYKLAGVHYNTTNSCFWSDISENWFVTKFAAPHGILFSATPIDSFVGLNHANIWNNTFGMNAGHAITVSNYWPNITAQNNKFFSTGGEVHGFGAYAGGNFVIQGNTFQNFNSGYPVILYDRLSSTNYTSDISFNNTDESGPLLIVGEFITGVQAVGNTTRTGDAVFLTGNNGFLNHFDQTALKLGTLARTNALLYADADGLLKPVELSGASFTPPTLTVTGGAATNGNPIIAAGALVASNGVFVGTTQRYKMVADTSLWYIYDNVAGRAPLAIDDADGDVTIDQNLTVSRLITSASNNVSGNINAGSVTLASSSAYDATSWNGDLSVPTKDALRDKIETISGGGGTNFPNVNLLLGGTNLTLSAGVRKAYHNQTNGSHGINLNLAVPESGYEVTYSVSNSGSSDISVTFYTNSVQANPYDIATKTNANTFTASASAITEAKLKFIGGGIWVLESVKGPASILKFGTGIWSDTNGANGLDITPFTRRYTNYASASITINCATDVTANYTNAVAANNTITLSTPVIGTSGSLGLVSDGSARTLAILAPVTITWLSTNDTATATNILTTASKRSLFAWRVGMGTDGVSTNIQCWVKNQTP